MTPSQIYAQGVATNRWQADAAQQAVLPHLDRIYHQLLARQTRSCWKKFTAHFSKPPAVQGFYLWGSVGRGKTFLADLLFDQLLTVPKRRWHFHRFMAEVHTRLRALPDTADTLAVVAGDLAKNMQLLLLDELFVGDIGDAMILGRLLDQLIEQGVTVVTTSNIAPGELYRDGLQRTSFLPAIALLERHCCVHKLESAQDYRLRELTQVATYLTPLSADNETALAACFKRLAMHPTYASDIQVHERAIAVKAQAEGIVWFEFSALCEGPRAVADYIEIACNFHTVLVSHVPCFDRENEDPARRFVHLIDEFYDRQVNFLASAAVDPFSLYQGARLRREFERTRSRLIEMQSAEYLAREHRPYSNLVRNTANKEAD